MLALLGVTWRYAGVAFAFMASVLLATPLAFVVEHCLRPAGARTWDASLRLATALAAVGFCAIYAVLAVPVVAIAIAVLAGPEHPLCARVARARRHGIENPRNCGGFP